MGPESWTAATSSPGFYSIAYVPEGDQQLLVSCGADGRLLTHGKDLSGDPVEHITTNPASKLLSLAAGPDNFVVGDELGYFSVHQAGKTDVCAVTAKLVPPGEAHALALLPECKDGDCTPGIGGGGGGANHLADFRLKPSPAIGGTNKARKEHKGDTRCLVMNPLGVKGISAQPADYPLIVAVMANGSVYQWPKDMKARKELPNSVKAPNVEKIGAARNGASWHPDGSLVAIPAPDFSAVVYDCMFWNELYKLDGPHEDYINLVSFSLDGTHAITAGMDKKVVLWETDRQKPLLVFNTPAIVSAIGWHPELKANKVALICENGQAGIWEDVVPMPPLLAPFASVDNSGYPELSGDEGSVAAGDEDGDEDDVGLEDFIVEDAKVARPRPKVTPDRVWQAPPATLPQPPFQPGSCSQAWGAKGKRLLCYNRLGSVTTMSNEEDVNHLLEISFHNLSKFRHACKKDTDPHDFCYASLSDQGVMLGSKSKKEKAVLKFKPLDPAKKMWTYQLPEGEQVLAVVAASTFCAAATSARLLRIFDLVGVETAVMSLKGDIVTLAGFGSCLAAVWHGAAPTPSGDQSLMVAIYDTALEQQLSEGGLPLSPGSTLTWLGFSDEEGILASHDSKGVMRLQSPTYGGSWLPVFSAADLKGLTGQKVYWPIGLNTENFFFFVCSIEDPYPKENQIQQTEPLTVPTLGQNKRRLVSKDAPASHFVTDTFLDSQALVLGARLACLQQAGAAEGAALVQDQLNRILLQLYHDAITMKQHNMARCIALVQRMQGDNWEYYLSSADKLAVQLRQTALSEEIQLMIEQRHEEQLVGLEGEEDPLMVEGGYASMRGTFDEAGGRGMSPPPDERRASSRSVSPPAAAPDGKPVPLSHGGGRHVEGDGRPPASIFTRAPPGGRAAGGHSGKPLSKENRGPVARRAAEDQAPAKRKAGNPFANRAAKVSKQ